MTAGTYAKGTTVPPERTRSEIETTLRRYGATSFVSGYEPGRAFLGFVALERNVRFVLSLPNADDNQFRYDGRGRWRDVDQKQKAADDEERRLWRCLLLAIKAKLEVVESGIESFEDAFLANIVLPGGQTVSERIRPDIAKAYELGVVTTFALGSGE